MSVRLYVGNLPKEAIERQALQDMFVEAGEGITTKVIKDRKTGKCRGFAFVTVQSDELADQFIEKYNGQAFMESPLKIEKALPRTKGKGKEGEEEVAGEEVGSSPSPAHTPEKPTRAAPSAARRSSSSSKKKGRSSGSSTTITTDSEGFQPDPRWAAELAQLRERLAAQPTNS
jgi:RNA recognition motif-containing protein